ncbi:MAG TPA: (2Fe-2S) ferredoxin domain-containing protein [Alphaproteobacteria bacterium]
MKAVLRPWPVDFTGRPTVTVCINDRDERFAPCCGRHGGPEIVAALREAVACRGLNVDVQTIKCLGLCAKGPNLRIAPSGSLYNAMTVEDVPAVVDALDSDLKSAKA